MDNWYNHKNQGGKNMKVFISWSGELSNHIAKELSIWLPSIIQSVTVFYSPEDIKKGENWDARLTNELENSDYGIVCLTLENITAPWIHFEAGALSKKLGSKVTALMVNVVTSDIQGPLSRFQATKLEKEDFYKLVKDINDESGEKIDENVLLNSFDAVWEKMYPQIDIILNDFQNTKKNKEVEKDKNINVAIEEILQVVRKQDAILSNPEKVLPLEYLKNVINESNKEKSIGGENVKEIENAIQSFCVALLFFIKDNLFTDTIVGALCKMFFESLECLGVSNDFMEYWKERIDNTLIRNEVTIETNEIVSKYTENNKNG